MPSCSGRTVQALAGITSHLASLSGMALLRASTGGCAMNCSMKTLLGSPPHVRAVLATRREDYNTQRPHSQLGWTMPSAFASAFTPRHELALRDAKGSSPGPAVHTTNHDAMHEFATG
jgi:hypothetical protein